MIDIRLIILVIGVIGVIYSSLVIIPRRDILFWSNWKIYCSYYIATILFLTVIVILILNMIEVINLRSDEILKTTYLWGISGLIYAYNAQIKLNIIKKGRDSLLNENSKIRSYRNLGLITGLFWLIGTYIINL